MINTFQTLISNMYFCEENPIYAFMQNFVWQKPKFSEMERHIFESKTYNLLFLSCPIIPKISLFKRSMSDSLYDWVGSWSFKIQECLPLPSAHHSCQYNQKTIQRQTKTRNVVTLSHIWRQVAGREKEMVANSVVRFLVTSTILLSGIRAAAMVSTSHSIAPTLALLLASVLPASPTLYSLAGACGCQCVTK